MLVHFKDLKLEDLLEILQLRAKVFVVEQNCAYQDPDNYDKLAHHLFLKEKNQIITYARILPKGTVYQEYCSIGRVVTHESYRKVGYGKKVMKLAITACKKLYPHQKIKISAQIYILHFYQSIGFEVVGEEYLEDGIPHVGMVYVSPVSLL